MQQVIANWKTHMQARSFRNEFALTWFAFFAAGSQNIHFIAQFELRQGVRLNDFILNHLTPIDFSNYIFAITYSVVFITLITLLHSPERLMKGLQMFALLSFLRTLSIYLVPLEPPTDFIFLNDPFANFLLHTPSLAVTKDLFFSGHTATLVLMLLLAEKQWHKTIAVIATVVAPTMILWQHVHYTIDVIAAFPAAYFCYRLVNWLHAQRSTKWQTANYF